MLQAASSELQTGEIDTLPGSVHSDSPLLAAEVALAIQVTRIAEARTILKWIRDSAETGRPQSVPTLAAGVIDEAIPIRVAPGDTAVRKHASLWLAAAGDFIMKHSSLDADARAKILLASFLPLLRIDSGKSFRACMNQAKDRLGEAIVILSIADLFGSDFERRFRNRSSDQDSPWALTNDALQISCATTAEIAKDCVVRLPLVESYDHEERDWLAGLDVASFEHAPEPWAAPEQLWRLAGEVTSAKDNMLLPREWADSPINWEKAGDWWRRLRVELTRVDRTDSRPAEHIAESKADGLGQATQDPTIADSTTHKPAAHDLNHEADHTADGSTDMSSRDSSTGGVPGELLSGGQNVGAFSVQAKDTAAPESDSLVKEQPSEESRRRLPVAQVMSHNDPVFVGAIQRLIASVRSSQSSLSLATVVIQPEQQSSAAESSTGLQDWQDALIVALNECPDLEKVLCFVTADGEFLVALPDLERNDASDILRQEIMRTIGATVQESAYGLAEAELPARFYAGIGTVVCPSTTFEAVQLVEAAQRCFTAARRQGSAAIKSIEVY